MQIKSTIIFSAIIISYISLGFIDSPTNIEESNLKIIKTGQGKAINWEKNEKLSPSDFKAKNRSISKSTAAITASAFGFSITDNNGTITGNIYVRFYCDSSWWNPDNKNSKNKSSILKHEQLHFDITELFGRKLYKEILLLRDSQRLNKRTIEKLHSRLEKEYSHYQNEYDKKTNHSINKVEQHYWNRMVKQELEKLKAYSNYTNF